MVVERVESGSHSVMAVTMEDGLPNSSGHTQSNIAAVKIVGWEGETSGVAEIST